MNHAWAYLPDVGETIARLMDREDELGDFETFHFAGHQLGYGEMGAAIRRVTGNQRLRIWPFPWPVVVALQSFVRLFREMAEMRHLWRRPISLDGHKLQAFLGTGLPATPIDEAVRETLAGNGMSQLKCLRAPLKPFPLTAPQGQAGVIHFYSAIGPLSARVHGDGPNRVRRHFRRGRADRALR